jgi:hypothetical protein
VVSAAHVDHRGVASVQGRLLDGLARAGRALLAALVLVCSMAPVLAWAAPPAGTVAVVVHPDAGVGQLTRDELQAFLLGTRRFWPNGARVELIIRGSPSMERTWHIERLCDMTEPRFRQYWIGMVFRGRATAPPRPLPSSQAVVASVAAIPGAIALVDASAVTAGVRVLAIDGLPPEHPKYPLR